MKQTIFIGILITLSSLTYAMGNHRTSYQGLPSAQSMTGTAKSIRRNTADFQIKMREVTGAIWASALKGKYYTKVAITGWDKNTLNEVELALEDEGYSVKQLPTPDGNIYITWSNR